MTGVIVAQMHLATCFSYRSVGFGWNFQKNCSQPLCQKIISARKVHNMYIFFFLAQKCIYTWMLGARGKWGQRWGMIFPLKIVQFIFLWSCREGGLTPKTPPLYTALLFDRWFQFSSSTSLLDGCYCRPNASICTNFSYRFIGFR